MSTQADRAQADAVNAARVRQVRKLAKSLQDEADALINAAFVEETLGNIKGGAIAKNRAEELRRIASRINDALALRQGDHG